MKKNEEKTEKLREIGVGCLLSRAVGKSKNLKGEGGESSTARRFRRDKGFAYISAKIEGGGGDCPSPLPFPTALSPWVWRVPKHCVWQP